MKFRILVLSLLFSSAANAAVYQLSLPSAVVPPVPAAQAATVEQAARPDPSLAPEQSAPVMLTVAPTAGEETRLAVDPVALNKQLSERNRKLRDENARLADENARLGEENFALQARIVEFTRLGGSEVHAYCADRTISRNTAGAEADCAGLGGYTCEDVSGLCRTRCQTTDMCAVGWVCDTGIEQCVNVSGG